MSGNLLPGQRGLCESPLKLASVAGDDRVQVAAIAERTEAQILVCFKTRRNKEIRRIVRAVSNKQIRLYAQRYLRSDSAGRDRVARSLRSVSSRSSKRSS